MLLLIVNSCKKDPVQQLPTQDISKLKTWYQFNHLYNSTNFLASLTPDWNTAYQKNQDGVFVIELDVDKPKSIAMMSGIADQNKLSSLASQTYTKLVLLKNLNTGNMDGCLMVISGKSTTDLEKLHYKNFTSLTGSVMYFDLHGNFVNGYKYTQGNIIANLTKALSQNYNEQLLANNSSSAAPLGIGNKKLMVVDVSSCNTEPIDIYVERCGSVSPGPISNPIFNPEASKANGVKLMSSNGGNGCVLVYSETIYQTNCEYTDPFEGGGGSYGGSGGESNDNNISIAKELKTDSIKKNFPCADKLIVQPILTSVIMSKFVAPFLTPQRPTITYQTANTLPWGNSTTGGTFSLGKSTPVNSGAGLSSTVTFNEKMMQNSSQLLIASSIIHETLHAYINYNIATAQNNYSNYDESNWMVGLNNFYLMASLPTDYSDHTMMLEDYFEKSMAVLQAWNAQKGFIYSRKDMAMATLYGLDNYNVGTSPSLISKLKIVFDAMKTKYNITSTDLTTFNNTNLNAIENKLPTTGCN